MATSIHSQIYDGIFRFCLISILLFHLSLGIEFVSRAQWHARPPKSVVKLNETPSYVFIHHTYIPAACYTLQDCIKAMQWIQNLHMDVRKWDDIGYSFAIGSDGRVYEGRGWDRVGAHTKGYNTVGLGFVVIGDYSLDIPNKLAIKTLHDLIEYGVCRDYYIYDYILRGHRDMVPTECPGQAFYDIIRTWPHY